MPRYFLHLSSPANHIGIIELKGSSLTTCSLLRTFVTEDAGVYLGGDSYLFASHLAEPTGCWVSIDAVPD